ncbi:hypothetical protein JCM14076_24670 [Methylosoma difficile]
MPSQTFTWLHLTDLHYGLQGQNCLWPNLREPFFDDLALLHDLSGPWDAVLFTGDLVQRGKSEEFNQLQAEFLDRLWQKLDELGSGAAQLLAVPGNHDLFRPDKSKPAAHMLMLPGGFDAIAETFWDSEKPDNEYRIVINEAFAPYREWWQNTPKRPSTIKHGLLPGDFASSLIVNGLNMGIVGLNTAFLQLQGGNYQGELVWDVRQLHEVCGDVGNWQKQHNFCLLLTHHSADWLTNSAKEHGRKEILPAGRFALHLFGHNHETNIESIRKIGNSDATWLCQINSIFGMEYIGESKTQKRDHGYAVGKIEVKEDQAYLQFWPRYATDEPDGWRFIADGRKVRLQQNQATSPEHLHYRKSKKSESRASTPTITAHQTASHSTLPPRQPFFGRTEELGKIAAYLQADFRGWGVVLDGPGGIGKTALAVEAAYRAPAEQYPHKLFVTAKNRRLTADGESRLHSHDFEDYHVLLTAIGLALGCDDIQRLPQAQHATVVRHELAKRRLLLVLDNLETLAKDERRCVYDLLDKLPTTCRAIVTSRRRDETAAHSLRLDKLDFPASQQLLVDLGQRLPPVANLTTAEQQRLYAETGGNPLLLTWTAGQLGRAQGRCRTVDAAVTRLQQAHEHNNDPLEFVFGDLLDTFTEDETAVLAALAYFPEPAPLDWLLPLAGISRTAAETALDDLRNRALLLEDEANDRWLLPALAGQFLRCHRPQAIAATGERLAAEAYALAVRHGYEENAPFVELEAAWPTVQAALPLMLAGDNERLQTVCEALVDFLNFNGRWDVWLSLSLDAEAKAVAAGDSHNAGWRVYYAGCVYHLQNDADALLACAERCTQHWQQARVGSREQATSIQLRGLGYQLRKDYPAALQAYQEVLALHRAINPDSVDVAIALSDLAAVKNLSGNWEAAEAYYCEALWLAQKTSDREGVALYTGNLAELALNRADWPAAERLAREALPLAQAVGRLELVAWNHFNLAKALLKQQRATEALPHAQEAVTIFSKLPGSPGLAKAQATLAECQAAI